MYRLKCTECRNEMVCKRTNINIIELIFKKPTGYCPPRAKQHSSSQSILFAPCIRRFTIAVQLYRCDIWMLIPMKKVIQNYFWERIWLDRKGAPLWSRRRARPRGLPLAWRCRRMKRAAKSALWPPACRGRIARMPTLACAKKKFKLTHFLKYATSLNIRYVISKARKSWIKIKQELLISLAEFLELSFIFEVSKLSHRLL